jgi:succinoglycan biosynthesis protein ExoA
MSDPPLVSVVVPCRNEAATIEPCLRSLLAQRRPAGGFEIIVADGMSDDGTRELLERLAREHRELRVIDNPGRIVSTGMNAAIAAANGTVIIRMDAHTEYAADYVQQSVAALQETGADAVGGPWVARGRTFLERAIAAAFQSPFAVGGARGHDPRYGGPIDTVYLGCWHRAIFERVGLFDEELVRNQDDEFSLRVVRSGGRIWQSPRIRSWYTPRGSLRALFRQYAQYGYWKVRVIQKHRLPASPRHLVPALFVASLAVLLAIAPWSVMARWGVFGIVMAYAVGNLVAAAQTARQSDWSLSPVLPLVFACYHVGYGVGFLQGLWDFVLLRRGGRAAFTTLTRASARR